MNRIFTIMLVVLFSSNIFADEKQYIQEAEEWGADVFAAKIFTADGKEGYHLYTNVIFRGGLEIKAGQICTTKGYTVIREETSGNNRRWIIKCNE